MKYAISPGALISSMIAGAFCLLLPGVSSVSAQNAQVQERLTEIKQAAAQNKQALTQYKWEERETISINGQVKKQNLYEVQLGPDGKPQKTEIASQPESQNGGRKHGLKHRMIERKKEEFEVYGEQIADLAQSYAHPDPDRLQQLFEQGNVTFAYAGAPGEVQVVIHNYLKPNDAVTLVYSRPQNAFLSIRVASYLKDPQDAVTISAQFAQVPGGGPSHVSSMQVNGASKQLTVSIQNSDYQRA